MAFLDELARMTGQAKNGVVQKTVDISEISKLSIKLSEAEKQKKQLLLQIGECYVRLHREDYEPDFQQIISQYLELEEHIQGIQGQIRAIRGIRLCQNCGAEIGRGSLFCQKCGTKAPQEEPPVPAGSVRCKRCGMIVSAEMNFCINCGSPLEAEPEKRFCVSCGAQLSPQAQFCAKCGTPNPLGVPQEETPLPADSQPIDGN